MYLLRVRLGKCAVQTMPESQAHAHSKRSQATRWSPGGPLKLKQEEGNHPQLKATPAKPDGNIPGRRGTGRNIWTWSALQHCMPHGETSTQRVWPVQVQAKSTSQDGATQDASSQDTVLPIQLNVFGAPPHMQTPHAHMPYGTAAAGLVAPAGRYIRW